MNNAVTLQWLDSAGSVIGQYALPTPLNAETMAAVNWAKVFDFTPIKPPIDTLTVHSAQGLNLRAAPSTQAAILAVLANGTQVDQLDTPPVAVGGLTWAEVVTTTSPVKRGWAAQQYLVKDAPPPVKPVAGRRVGLHMLQDARPAVTLFLDQLKAAGRMIPSATVINDVGLANDLVTHYGIPYVIFRGGVADGAYGVQLGSDPTGAGRALVSGGWNSYSNLDPRAFIQITNELPYLDHHNEMWLGVMAECEARGRKAAIGAYSVGAVEVDQMKAMTEAMRYAKQHGHVFALHVYAKQGTPPGELSGADSQYYETRFIRLYDALPADARPDLILSEFACQFSRGQFQGAPAMLHFISAFADAVKGCDYLKAYNQWSTGSAGGWSDACIDSALPDLARYLS